MENIAFYETPLDKMYKMIAELKEKVEQQQHDINECLRRAQYCEWAINELFEKTNNIVGEM